MYELGQYIGSGGYSAFFHIKEHPSLGIKIRIDDFNATSELREELNKARILRKIGLSIPRYVDIITVAIPATIEFTLEKSKDIPARLKYALIRKAGKKISGLVIEYVESDLTLVSKARLGYLIKKETQKVVDCGIIIPYDTNSNNNILWSVKQSKIYFIDFDQWKFPDTIIPQKKSFLERVFS